MIYSIVTQHPKYSKLKDTKDIRFFNTQFHAVPMLFRIYTIQVHITGTIKLPFKKYHLSEDRGIYEYKRTEDLIFLP